MDGEHRHVEDDTADGIPLTFTAHEYNRDQRC